MKWFFFLVRERKKEGGDRVRLERERKREGVRVILSVVRIITCLCVMMLICASCVLCWVMRILLSFFQSKS